jgi:ATP-dependent Clp protease ATP-binding subunit ClpC
MCAAYLRTVLCAQCFAWRAQCNPCIHAYLTQTAIAEGLAHAIVGRRNPDGTPLPTFLHNKRILQLDVGLIVAGGWV